MNNLIDEKCKLEIHPLSNLGKRGQMAIFVIIAIVIVVGVVLFFVLRGEIDTERIPAQLEPVYNYYSKCIEEDTYNALSIAGSQGGRIDAGEYVPGSEYAPFSNQLNFLGFPVPYWYYVSGNGLIKENVPSKEDVEKEIGEYLERSLIDCNFDSFYGQEFDIEFDEPSVDVSINDGSVDINVQSVLLVEKGEEKARKSSHSVSVNSEFGEFYNLAREIYDKEKKESFLEDYGVDVLMLYTPVDGVEIQCAPKVWKTREVIDELKEAMESNVGALKLGERKGDDYFVIEGLSSDKNVGFMYSRSWPTKVEVSGEGVDDELMVAETVGNQEGMGIMGFCYAPYHFVYDFSYPVMVQIYNNEEIFQFPVAIIIDNNAPREAKFAEGYDYLNDEEFDLCDFKENDVTINVYDINLNSINEAEISYECFTQKCRLGESENGKLVSKTPGCVNGHLSVRKEGFEDKKILFSSNRESVADIVMDREHEVEVELKVGEEIVSDKGMAIFSKEDGKSVSAVLPDVKNVKLSEGQYTISVYVYSDSSIILPSSTKTQCHEVPRSGIAGFFGSTKEECFDITIPETKIESALAGGGKEKVYILESELNKGKVVLSVDSLNAPGSLEDLYSNFAAFELQGVGVDFE